MICKNKKFKSILSVVICACMLFGLTPVFDIQSVALTTSVSSLAGLTAALTDSDIDEIIVTQTITLPNGTELYGNGKTVRAEITGVDEQGIVQNGSDYTVFKTASDATVHIYDMTIMGGSISAVINETGKLYLDNVTITRSGSDDNAGGGLKNGVQNLSDGKNTSHKTAYVIMKNSSIVRNVAIYGGGFMNYGTLIMDGCSLSENRSINVAGGGGAGENEGYAYLNNCTVANNTSSEIGGGINVCKGGELYIMNCTFTGNVTYCNGGNNFGGAVGDNDCVVKAVNSIFANNYYINKSTQTVTPNDIGLYSGNDVTAYNSIVGTVSGGTATLENCSSNTDNLFAAYVTGNVLAGDGTESTADFSKPAVVQNASGELYTPVSGDYQGDIEGVPTYFDYSDLDNIRMYFTDEDDTTFFAGSAVEPTDMPVGNALDDSERETTLIGSSNSLGEGKTIYTIKVKASEHGSIKGGTIYGDSYIVITDGSVVSAEEIITVKLEATPDSGYYFSKWLFEDANAVVEPPVSASSITALESAIAQAGSATSGTRRRTAAQAIKTAIINITTTNAEIQAIITTARNSTISNYSNVSTTALQNWVTRAQNIIDINNEVASGGGWTEVSGNNPYEFVVDRNISLKAEFVAQAPNYTVTFHSNTEPETTVTQTFAAGHYTANLTANSFTNDGQPFLGWALVDCGDVEYADGASFTANGNADLYARWGYTVDYNANGGRNAPDSQIKNPGADLKISGVAPTRDGYTFKGWGLSADASDAVLQPGDVYGVDKNVTFYAIWDQLKAPTVLDDTLDNGYLNVPYSDTIETDQDAIFILTDGSVLPDGLTLSKDGTLSGTPTSTGTYTFSIALYNKEDVSLTNASTITITVTIADPKAALQDLVDQANTVDQNNYTSETAENLQDAIDDAQAVLDNPNATQDEINNAIEELTDALNQLALDKSALAAAIAQGNLIAEDPAEAGKYTADTLSVLENALTAGEIVYANTNATAEQIASATQAILDAINSLSRIIDKDDLQNLVNEANAINQDDYTDTTSDALQDAIDDAQAVLDDPNATDEEIQNAYEALENAINNLIDRSELADAIEDGNVIVNGDTSAYTSESVQALEEAIAAGETVYNDPDASQAEIDAATEAIRDALEDLLEEAVDNAEDIVNNNSDNYTDESIQALEDAITDAEDVINNPNSTPDEIKDAIEAIENAINNLVDRSKLADAIEDGNVIVNGDTSAYTPTSVQALEEAIAAGETVYNDPDASQAEIDAATEAIRNALEDLLEEAVDNAEDIVNNNSDNYTDESIQALEDAITDAEDVINNPNSTPDEIKDAIESIENAINGLTLKVITPKASSDIHVDRNTGTEYTYMVGIYPDANSVADIKNQLENEGTTIIILRNDVELTADELVGTGCVVKCVSKNDPSIVYEIATVILYGDVNGDGRVDYDDKELVKADAFEDANNIQADTVFYIAADLSKDRTIDAFDYFDQDGIISGVRPFDQTLTLYKD
ncbi:MAG: hypothetical protein E7514_07685 [Ruminococcaceae bacterium]|nr:hypothetical protein [Oscillospiraceae bacterium]